MTLRFLRVIPLVLFALLVLSIFVLHPVAVYAADAGGSEVHLAPLIDYLFEIIFAVIGALAIWAVHRYARKLGLQINDQQRAFLDQAIQNGIAWALKTAEAAAESRFGTVSVKDPKIALAANYVVAHAPDAIAHFGVTAEQLERKIVAKLPA